jgi:hypothetical protein
MDQDPEQSGESGQVASYPIDGPDFSGWMNRIVSYPGYRLGPHTFGWMPAGVVDGFVEVTGRDLQRSDGTTVHAMGLGPRVWPTEAEARDSALSEWHAYRRVLGTFE